MGITGLETSFPVLYTELVKKNHLSLSELTELMSIKPGKRFNINSGIKEGAKADLCVFDLDAEYEIEPDSFLSMGRATPFKGKKVYGKCVMTLCGGKIVYKER